jgi:hypothetical protein
MGWWQGENEIDLLGDGPADTLSGALQEIAKVQRRKPTLQELLEALHAALLLAPESLLLESDIHVAALAAHMNDGSTVSTHDATRPGDLPVKLLYQALQDIVTDYEDMEDHRKPRLRELLATAAFILGPDDQDFVQSPTGSGVRSIAAEIRSKQGSEGI